MLISEQQDSCSPAASHSSCQQPGFKELARATSLDQANHTTGSELLHLDGRGFGLTSPSGHACFEVWIAMELCDGGTLAEQVARGFQYCPQSHHVDLVSNGTSCNNGWLSLACATCTSYACA